MAYDSPSSSSLPSWLGFVVGLLAGFAVSALVIGFIAGYSLGGGLPAGSRPVAQNPTPTPEAPADVPPAPSKPVPPVTKEDHVRGNPDAKITIVQYSDFECPFCKRHAPTLDQVLDTYEDDVNVVYRHFPLSFHPNAQKLAEASECVAEQAGNDGFWKFHDAVFALAQVSNSADVLAPLAKAAGANEAKFKDCLASDKYAQLVNDQMQGGIDAGVQGTPGNFIINNDTDESQEISGAVPFTSFQTAIDAILGKK